MKIAITSGGPTLDDRVEARFGRCPYFVLVDPDTLKFEAIPNPNITLGGGAGTQSARLMADRGVTVVLTGNCGPNAFQTFGAAGIQVLTGVGGMVREAVERFKTGQLAQSSSADPGNSSGMGAGMGMGRGMGMGGGKGRRRLQTGIGEPLQPEGERSPARRTKLRLFPTRRRTTSTFSRRRPRA